MAKMNRPPGPQRAPFQQGGAPRPSLTPQNPLPGRVALLQAMVLLGLPLTLLFVAKIILKEFFPQLGY